VRAVMQVALEYILESHVPILPGGPRILEKSCTCPKKQQSSKVLIEAKSSKRLRRINTYGFEEESPKAVKSDVEKKN
jgi:hypothetical protein